MMRLQGEEEEEQAVPEKSGQGEERGGGPGGDPNPNPKKKQRAAKPYRRHPKPPFSYLALIALVIQAAPQKRLKLSQILSEIERLFPLFSGGYQGWKDSIRHNLSSNSCFFKVGSNSKAHAPSSGSSNNGAHSGLANPGIHVIGVLPNLPFHFHISANVCFNLYCFSINFLFNTCFRLLTCPPLALLQEESDKWKGKRNFWRVDVSRIPLGLLKRQNTSRGHERGPPFVPDLAPFVLQGKPYPPAPQEGPDPNRTPTKRDLPSRGASFRIEELVPEATKKKTPEEESPPILYTPCFRHCPPAMPGHCGVGMDAHCVSPFPLHPFHPFPLPSPSTTCLNPACSLLVASPAFSLHLGHPSGAEAGHGLHSTPMDPQLCCLSYPPAPGWLPY
ncbi:forkhead box protein H1 [Anolis carolinensis]|uniref:forkhead box protein H1 n=1 Tax=Anolis carolinensis TaxID=28377 RepID=UPI002F2B47AB